VEQQRAGKQGIDDSIKQFITLRTFSHNTCMKRDGSCILNCLYASIHTLFPTFFCSAIPTSHYNVFRLDYDAFNSMCMFELKFVIYQAVAKSLASSVDGWRINDPGLCSSTESTM